MAQLQNHLAALSGARRRRLLCDIRRGIEKEGLRVTPGGSLAMNPHPPALGSALTHPYLTTDYSEALLELISPTCREVEEVLGWLADLHRFLLRKLDGELLWGGSMPCALGPDDSIPVARYGTSNLARMKTTYRLGLQHRYGPRMQMVAGLHYNFSLPEAFWPVYQSVAGDRGPLRDFITASYFSLVRNCHRHSWLLPYLFGASPVADASFPGRRRHDLQPLPGGDWCRPWGTTLRMGELGYRSRVQEAVMVSCNSLDDYILSLARSLHRPHPDYQRIGVREGDDYRQLSDSILQIENEFYSPVRPKRTTRRGQTPLAALREGGVEYVEVRCLDLNPERPLGLDAEAIRFLDTFLLHCLLEESPPMDEACYRRNLANFHAVTARGRQPGLELETDSGRRPLAEWGAELLGGIRQTARLLDAAWGGEAHEAAVQAQALLIAEPQRCPSVREQGGSWTDWMLERSRAFAEQFRSEPGEPVRMEQLERLAPLSLRRQQELEAEDTLDFPAYLESYYQQNRLPEA